MFVDSQKALQHLGPFLRSTIAKMTIVAIVLGAVTGARAQNVITTVAVGNSPTAIAADPATDQVYVANFGSANVTVINGTLRSASGLSSDVSCLVTPEPFAACEQDAPRARNA